MSGATSGSNILLLRLPPDLQRWLMAKAVRDRMLATEIAILAIRRLMESEVGTSGR